MSHLAATTSTGPVALAVGVQLLAFHAAAVKRDQTVVPDHAPALRVGAGRHTDAECGYAEKILHLMAPLSFAPNNVYLSPARI